MARWLRDQEHLLPFAALLEGVSSDPGAGASLAACSQLPGTLAPEDREPSSGLCLHLNTRWIQIKTFCLFFWKEYIANAKIPSISPYPVSPFLTAVLCFQF